MKVVNPVGRVVNTGAEANFTADQPRACMCSSTGGTPFATTRGDKDHCFRCSCSCGMSSGNDFRATWRIGKS